MLYIYGSVNPEEKFPLQVDDDKAYREHKYDGRDFLQFEIQRSHEIYSKLLEEVTVDGFGNRFVIKYIDEHSDFVTVRCDLDLSDWQATILKDFRPTNATVVDVMTRLLPDGWTITYGEQVNVSLRTTVEEYEGRPFRAAVPLDILPKVMEKYGVVFNYDVLNRHVDVINPDSFTSSGEFFSEDINLRALGFNGSSDGFATRLYAYGAKDEQTGQYLSFADINGGKEYVEDNSYSGKLISVAWVDERYTNKESLLADARAKLAAIAAPLRSYTCDINNFDGDFWLYKVVTIIDKNRRKRIDHQVVTYREYRDHAYDQVTLSQQAPAIEATIKANKAAADEEAARSQVFIQQVVLAEMAKATDMITGNQGGSFRWIYDGDGKMRELVNLGDSDNINTAQKVWRWNAGGLGHSNNGYNGTYGIALTADGAINASMITVGILNAIVLRAGTITDVTGDNYWNLETGEFHFEFTSGDFDDVEIASVEALRGRVATVEQQAATFQANFQTFQSVYNSTIQSMQQQIDGAIETWTGSAVPTLSNYPVVQGSDATSWNTPAKKDTHIGDLYVVNADGGDQAGFYYRFEKIDPEVINNSNYRWVLLKDSEITKALQDAADANAAAGALANNLANNYYTRTATETAIQQNGQQVLIAASQETETQISKLHYENLNLFSWENAEAGFYIDGEGQQVSNNTIATSGMIPVDPSTPYQFSIYGADGVTRIWYSRVYYDNDGACIANSYDGNYVDLDFHRLWTTPATAAYARISVGIVADHERCKVKFEKGEVVTDWTPGLDDMTTKESMRAAVQVAADEVGATVEQTIREIAPGGSENLFVLGTATENWYISGDTSQPQGYSNTNYWTSDFIAVEEGVPYQFQMWLDAPATAQRRVRVTYYNDAQDTIVAGLPTTVNYIYNFIAVGNTYGYQQFTTPSGVGAVYARVSVSGVSPLKVKFEKGTKRTAYSQAPDDATRLYAKLAARATGIESTVSQKVGLDEIISRINQSAESVAINASKINLSGYVTVSSLGASGSTIIDASRIQTGTLRAITVEGVTIRGSTIQFGDATLHSDGEDWYNAVPSTSPGSASIWMTAPVTRFHIDTGIIAIGSSQAGRVQLYVNDAYSYINLDMTEITLHTGGSVRIEAGSTSGNSCDCYLELIYDQGILYHYGNSTRWLIS